MGQPFVWQVRVYWEDTDAGGVVYHSRYLNFFERARTEWLRSLGVHQAELAERNGILFIIRRIEVDFVRAAKMDDILDVSVHSVAPGGARMVFRQDMLRTADGETLARAAVTAACLEAASFKPVRLPGWLQARLTAAE